MSNNFFDFGVNGGVAGSSGDDMIDDLLSDDDSVDSLPGVLDEDSVESLPVVGNDSNESLPVVGDESLPGVMDSFLVGVDSLPGVSNGLESDSFGSSRDALFGEDDSIVVEGSLTSDNDVFVDSYGVLENLSSIEGEHVSSVVGEDGSDVDYYRDFLVGDVSKKIISFDSSVDVDNVVDKIVKSSVGKSDVIGDNYSGGVSGSIGDVSVSGSILDGHGVSVEPGVLDDGRVVFGGDFVGDDFIDGGVDDVSLNRSNYFLSSPGTYSGNRDFGMNDGLGNSWFKSDDSSRVGSFELDNFLRVDNLRSNILRSRVGAMSDYININSFDVLDVRRGNSGSVVSVSDMMILDYLSMFRYSKVIHIQRVLGLKSRGAVNYRLDKLFKLGLVRFSENPLMGKVYYLTSQGASISSVGLSAPPKFSTSRVDHHNVINHIASHLWNNTLNVLNLPDFPAHNRFDVKSGELVRGERLVSESMLDSSFNSLTYGDRSAQGAKSVAFSASQDLFTEWSLGGKVSCAPEFVEGNEFLFYLLSKSGSGSTRVKPDLVVVRDRGESRTPACIAVEVELKRAKRDDLEHKIGIYADDLSIYERVVWVVRSKADKNRIQRAIDVYGADAKRKIKVIPIIVGTNQGQGFKKYNLFEL